MSDTTITPTPQTEITEPTPVSEPVVAPVEMAHAIDIRNIKKSYTKGKETVTIMEDFSLVVPHKAQGEILAILGMSGCGKSTLLNMIGGEYQPTSGEIFTYGRQVIKDNPFTVTVQQDYTTFPWLSVMDNVMLGLRTIGIDEVKAQATALEYLAKVGLDQKAHVKPSELSGGQRQRVAIARCLSMKPRILLMDEPFGALDAKIREDMQQMLLHLWQQEENTVVMVTHDITEALLMADRVIVLSSAPAEIIADFEVPFPRPRAAEELTGRQDFVEMSHAIFRILKQQGGTGQFRVSV